MSVRTTEATVFSRKYGTTFEATNLTQQNTESGAHGLGRIPDGWEGVMECVVADKGWAVGDQVPWKPPPWRQTVYFDATHTHVLKKNQGFGIIDKDSTTGSSTNIDLLDWKVVVRPYIYEEVEVVSEVDGTRGSATEGNVQGDVIATGNIDVTSGATFPTSANIPHIPIPGDEGYLLVDIGKPTATGYETADTFWLDVAALLEKDEAGYGVAASVSNARRIADSIDAGADFYAGWVTDPNDAAQKLLLLTAQFTTDDFLGVKVSKPVVEAVSVSNGALVPISELPALDASNFEWIWNLDGTLVQNVGEPLTTSTLAVTYADVTNGGTINLAGHANVRYRGAHYGSAAVRNPVNNDIFVNLLGGQIWYYIHVPGDELQDGWHPATQALLNAMGYLGYRSSRSRADQLVAHASGSKVGLYVGFGGLLRRVTAFVDETETHTVYHPREYVPHTPVPGSIVVDEEPFYTTAEIADPALTLTARDVPIIPTGAGTLTERGSALGFARAAADPFNLTYEREANQAPVVGVMVTGATDGTDVDIPATMFFGNVADDGDDTFAATDVKVADGRYLRVRADVRKGSGDTVDIRIYGGDTPVATDVTLDFYAIVKVE